MQPLRSLVFVIFLILLLSLNYPQPGLAEQGSDMQFLSPGEGSLVTSPIHLAAEITSNPVSMVRTVLVDRGGITLARQLLRVSQDVGGDPFQFTTLIPFDIPETSVEALLTVTAIDADYRPIVTRSVTVMLQSGGEPELQAQQPEVNWLDLTEPEPLQAFSGGEIHMKGTVTPLTQEPVVIELITSEGRVVGSTQLPVAQPGQLFEVDLTLPYSRVKTSTNTRLIVRQAADPYQTDAILDSLLITLLP